LYGANGGCQNGNCGNGNCGNGNGHHDIFTPGNGAPPVVQPGTPAPGVQPMTPAQPPSTLPETRAQGQVPADNLPVVPAMNSPLSPALPVEPPSVPSSALRVPPVGGQQ
jgi:hypothetical protein